MLQESAALVLLLSNLPYKRVPYKKVPRINKKVPYKKAPRLTEYISWQDVQEKS